MLLSIELVIITILVLALAALFIEEIGTKKAGVSKGVVSEYWNGKERRLVRRVRAELSVRYSVENKARLKLNGAIKDISQKGVRLLLIEKLAEGTLLLLEFDTPGTERSIIADGKVVWSSGAFEERNTVGKRIFEAGVQFVKMWPDDDARLASYIDKISA